MTRTVQSPVPRQSAATDLTDRVEGAAYHLRARLARGLLVLGRILPLRWLVGVMQLLVGAGRRRALRLRPTVDLQQISDAHRTWEAVGPDPQFVSADLWVRIPKGWCHLDARLTSEVQGTLATLYVDQGGGFRPVDSGPLPIDPIDGVSGLVRVPLATRSIRFDPIDLPGRFQLGMVTLTQASLGVQLLGMANRAGVLLSRLAPGRDRS